jgi:hypothetical protein
MGFRVLRSLTFGIAIAASSSCLTESDPSSVSVPIAAAILNGLGECLIEIPHQTLSGTSIVACGALPRGNCNSAGVLMNSLDVASLRSEVATLGTTVTTCPFDALTETTSLDSLQPPNLPEFVKAGGTTNDLSNQAKYFVIESCAAVGLTSSPYIDQNFQQLQTVPAIFQSRDARIYLNRYATINTCRNAIPLNATERQTAENLRAGTFRDFIYCDINGAGDPALNDCPATITEIIN